MQSVRFHHCSTTKSFKNYNCPCLAGDKETSEKILGSLTNRMKNWNNENDRISRMIRKAEMDLIFKERKEMFYLTTHILFTVIWRRTYGKGPF